MLCSDWRISEGWKGQTFLGCRDNLWQWRCQCRKRGSLCIYEFEQEISLVMNKYSLHVSLPGGSGQSASSGFPGSLNGRGGPSYQLQISWVSSGLQIIDWHGTEVWKATASWWKASANCGNAQIIFKDKQTQVMTGWQDLTWSAMEDRAWPGLSVERPTAQKMVPATATTSHNMAMEVLAGVFCIGLDNWGSEEEEGVHKYWDKKVTV